MAVRLKDIARDLGLSVSSISNALHDNGAIGERNRKRVLKRAKELNYQPNFAALSLATGQTWTIGLVLPCLQDSFFAEIAESITVAVHKRGYRVLISLSNEDPELEKQEIEQLLARRVDVLLVASAQSTVESFRAAEERKVPYILLDRQFLGLSANFVGVDDREVGRIATAHLIEQGCQRVAHIRGPQMSTAIGRLEGYLGALADRHKDPLPGHVVSVRTSIDYDDENGAYEAARMLISSPNRPDAIFCFNDRLALGAMRAIFEAGLRIPEDVAIVGCGNLYYNNHLRVPLSSVDQASKSIGKTAAAMALKLAHKRKPTRLTQPLSELIRPQMMARASSLRSRLRIQPGAQ